MYLSVGWCGTQQLHEEPSLAGVRPLLHRVQEEGHESVRAGMFRAVQVTKN